ncbi:MAG: hypothetical protein ABL977_05190 [Candidatus Eisenbacteria bacterium]
MTMTLEQLLATDTGIDTGYTHRPKYVVAGSPLATERAVLKWYELARLDEPVSGDVRDDARRLLQTLPLEAAGFGFVILHRCGGTGFYFLMVCTWRNNNELWETVFARHSDAEPGFVPFARDGAHKPAFCVWELAVVEHEKRAWQRFLDSRRDEPAARLWWSNTCTGAA